MVYEGTRSLLLSLRRKSTVLVVLFVGLIMLGGSKLVCSKLCWKIQYVQRWKAAMVTVGNLQYSFMLNLYCGQCCKPSSSMQMSKGSLLYHLLSVCSLQIPPSLQWMKTQVCCVCVFHWWKPERMWRVCKGTSLCSLWATASVTALLNSGADQHGVSLDWVTGVSRWKRSMQLSD